MTDSGSPPYHPRKGGCPRAFAKDVAQQNTAAEKIVRSLRASAASYFFTKLTEGFGAAACAVACVWAGFPVGASAEGTLTVADFETGSPWSACIAPAIRAS